MDSFSKSYIKKCIKHREEINYTIGRARGSFPEDGIGSRSHFFEVEDYFHCPEKMDPLQVIKVSATGEYSVSGGTPSKAYDADRCVHVPTEELLAAGLKARQFSVGLQAHGEGPEALLDAYIEAKKRFNG